MNRRNFSLGTAALLSMSGMRGAANNGLIGIMMTQSAAYYFWTGAYAAIA